MKLKRALVIEDDPDVAKVLKLALQQLGAASVSTAGNGDLGLEMALAQPFQLLLVDLLLPGRDGYDVLRQLRARSSFRPIVVLVTSAAGHLDRRTIESLGADALVEKPFSVGELLDCLRGLLAERQRTEA